MTKDKDDNQEPGQIPAVQPGKAVEQMLAMLVAQLVACNGCNKEKYSYGSSNGKRF